MARVTVTWIRAVKTELAAAMSIAARSGIDNEASIYMFVIEVKKTILCITNE